MSIPYMSLLTVTPVYPRCFWVYRLVQWCGMWRYGVACSSGVGSGCGFGMRAVVCPAVLSCGVTWESGMDNGMEIMNGVMTKKCSVV